MDQNRRDVHFGPFRSANRTLAIPDGQLSQAIPQFYTHGSNTVFVPMHATRTIRISALRGPNSVFLGGTLRYDRQGTLVIRIVVITFTSDFAITIARFRTLRSTLRSLGDHRNFEGTQALRVRRPLEELSEFRGISRKNSRNCTHNLSHEKINSQSNSRIGSWNCGRPRFQPKFSEHSFWQLGFCPAANTRVRACQGADIKEEDSWLPCVQRFGTHIRDKKNMAMAMFKRKFARTIPDNLRAPHIKMWGFEAKRARKFTRTSPRTLPFFFHYHAFFFPEHMSGFLEL